MEYPYRSIIHTRLKQAGLHVPADAFRDAFLSLLKAENETAETRKPSKQIVEEAWRMMGDVFTPPMEKIEKLKEKVKRAEEKVKRTEETRIVKQPKPTFQGYTRNLDDLVDPNYQEKDQNKRVRDAWFWLGDNFRRITRDLPDGSTIQDFSKAKMRPPTEFAIQLAETYGRMAPDKREGMITRLTQFAEKTYTPGEPSKEVDTSEADAYLAALEEDESCSGRGPETI